MTMTKDFLANIAVSTGRFYRCRFLITITWYNPYTNRKTTTYPSLINAAVSVLVPVLAKPATITFMVNQIQTTTNMI